MVGEGNTVDFDVSQTIIHNQITIYGSWVTSLGHMEDLVEKLVEWNLKPEVIVTHRFPLDPGRRSLPRGRRRPERQSRHRL